MQTPLALQQIRQLRHCEAQLTINKIILIHSVITKKKPTGKCKNEEN